VATRPVGRAVRSGRHLQHADLARRRSQREAAKDRYVDGVDQSSFFVADNGQSARHARIYTMNQYLSAVRVDEFKHAITAELRSNSSSACAGIRATGLRPRTSRNARRRLAAPPGSVPPAIDFEIRQGRTAGLRPNKRSCATANVNSRQLLGIWAISGNSATLWQRNTGFEPLYFRHRVWFIRAGSPHRSG